jgi:hypothetical protein
MKNSEKGQFADDRCSSQRMSEPATLITTPIFGRRLVPKRIAVTKDNQVRDLHQRRCGGS